MSGDVASDIREDVLETLESVASELKDLGPEGEESYSFHSERVEKKDVVNKMAFKPVMTSDQFKTTLQCYRVGKQIGKGAFGKVSLAKQKLTHIYIALKSIKKEYLKERKSKVKLRQEVSILEKIHHDNIVKLYETFETSKHLVFVMELCTGGDLLSYVRRRRKLKEPYAKVIFKQIIEGLEYCHSKRILHRDVKLENILLNQDGVVKVCDFGVSRIMQEGEILTDQCGTPAYIAPEILLDKGYKNFTVDIWSAGVVLYAMLYGTIPFKHSNLSELHKMIVNARFTL